MLGEPPVFQRFKRLAIAHDGQQIGLRFLNLRTLARFAHLQGCQRPFEVRQEARRDSALRMFGQLLFENVALASRAVQTLLRIRKRVEFLELDRAALHEQRLERKFERGQRLARQLRALRSH